MKAMNCKHCDGIPEFHIRSFFVWAICNNCGFEVVRIAESDDKEQEHYMLVRDWNLHQFSPETEDKNY